MAHNVKSHVPVLLLLTTIFYLNFFSRVIFSPLLPSIEKDLRISHGEAGAIYLVISCGYFISLLGSGFVSARMGHHRTIVSSLFLISAGLMSIAFQDLLSMLLVSFFVLGLGAGLYLPSAIATISDLFAARHWGKAFAVHELAPNLAFLSAPLCTSVLLTRTGWQQVVLLLTIATFSACCLYAMLGKGKKIYGTPPHIRTFLAILQKPDFQILVVLFSFGISSTIGIFNILPLLLVSQHAYSLQDANVLVGLSRVLTLGTALLGGWIADRFGNLKTITYVLLFAGLSTSAIGITSDSSLIVSIFLQALIAVTFFPAGFALLSRLAEPSERNLVISLAIPLSFLIGGGIIPALIMLLADLGHFNAGVCMAGLLIVFSTFLVPFLKENQIT